MALRRSARVSAIASTAGGSSVNGAATVRNITGNKTSHGGVKKNQKTSKTPQTKAAREAALKDVVAEPPSTPPRSRSKKAKTGATEGDGQHDSTANTLPTSTPNGKAVDETVNDPHLYATPRATHNPILDRPASPRRTNATLKTPGGSRHVAYNSTESPSTSGLPAPSSSTTTLLQDAIAHLISVDPRLEPFIQKNHCKIFAPEGLAEEVDPFQALTSGICAQQVSGAAAKSIRSKFVALFNDESTSPHIFPTPAQVVQCDLAKLRSAGLSGRKAEYIMGLAEKFVSGELSTEMLVRASDEEVLEKLIAVRGLGRWSVEMFACFGLKRMDVFSTGDLGVQRGMAAFMGKDVGKLKAKGGGKWKYMTEKDMLEYSAPFAPYRSLFMWYMWRVEDVDVDALQSK